jgi:hypothetical protein
VSDEFPQIESRIQLRGPYDTSIITVDGRKIPFLEAEPVIGGRIDLTLDSRFGLVLTLDEFERFVPFLADAIAIALGYTCHPRIGWEGPVKRTEFPRISDLNLDESQS